MIHQALIFTAQYSEASGKPKESTAQIQRVRNIVFQIVDGLQREFAIQKRDGTLNPDGTLSDAPKKPLIYLGKK